MQARSVKLRAMAKREETTQKSEAPPIEDGDRPYTQLMTTKDIANFLRVSRSTITRMANHGQIPFVLVRGRKRFDVAAVMAAINRVS
jgi:excisionase family DNA binding protein